MEKERSRKGVEKRCEEAQKKAAQDPKEKPRSIFDHD